jgi:hypothetical protein
MKGNVGIKLRNNKHNSVIRPRATRKEKEQLVMGNRTITQREKLTKKHRRVHPFHGTFTVYYKVPNPPYLID